MYKSSNIQYEVLIASETKFCPVSLRSNSLVVFTTFLGLIWFCLLGNSNDQNNIQDAQKNFFYINVYVITNLRS